MIYAATSTKTPLILACPKVKGDFVILHWQPPDAVKHNMKLVYQYDRWTGESMVPGKTKKLWLTGSPVSAVAGSFAFTLSPEVVDGGLYSCDVYLNDDSYTQWTQLSVLKGNDQEQEQEKDCFMRQQVPFLRQPCDTVSRFTNPYMRSPWYVFDTMQMDDKWNENAC